jgi:uncharacterized protein (DUF2147 family)
MNVWIKTMCVPMLLLSSSLATAMSADGLWASHDDVTGKKRAIIRVSQEHNKLQATIVKIFKEPGDTGICSHCPGAFKNKPILGLKFAWDLVPTGKNAWGEGHILDPQTGKIYRAKMQLENENSLAVRGYYGVSLLGRTNVWHRE